MNQLEVIRTLANWNITFKSFVRFSEINGYNANSETDKLYEQPDILKSMVLDYINLRLSFYAIHNEPLSENLTLYKEGNLYYPSKRAYYEYQSIIKHGIAITGTPSKTKEIIIEESLQEGLANNYKWFYDKYSEEPVSFVTDFNNAKEQFELFKDQINQGLLYPHYRVNMICLQNDFDLRSAYRYLKENRNHTLEGYISSVLAITTLTGSKQDKKMLRVHHVGDLVFPDVKQMKRFYPHFKETIEYNPHAGVRNKEYAEFFCAELQKEYPNIQVEFNLKSLNFPKDPKEPFNEQLIADCKAEILERYNRGILLGGVLYDSVWHIESTLPSRKLSVETTNFLKYLKTRKEPYINADRLLAQEGFKVIPLKKSFTIKKLSKVETGVAVKSNSNTDTETTRVKKTSHIQIEDNKTKPKTKSSTKSRSKLSKPRKLDKFQDEQQFVIDVNMIIKNLGINHMDLADFIFQFEGKEFHQVKVTEDINAYHQMLEIYLNLIMNYLLRLNTLPQYAVTIVPKTFKQIAFTKVLQSGFYLNLINDNFKVYVTYKDLESNPNTNILQWFEHFQLKQMGVH